MHISSMHGGYRATAALEWLTCRLKSSRAMSCSLARALLRMLCNPSLERQFPCSAKPLRGLQGA